MGIFNKIVTAIRGGATEAGQAVVDANAIRIFEQEIRDSKNAIEKGKRDLTGVMADKMKEERKVKELSADIEKYESKALQLMEKGDEALAMEVAEKIAEIENELAVHKNAAQAFTGKVATLKELMKKAERTIRDHERELNMVKTTESVQKAQMSINASYGSGIGKLGDAKESLNRIKAKQQEREDRMKASEQLEAESGTGSLDEKLKAAGVGEQSSGGSDVLARLRAKKSGGQ
ncbi:MAG: PspA/IM30 family protein [Ectothiorhodospiraceae bacterium]|nr:PspA/IM30 family protein [Ectothiorhodospiraceae bacterium]